MAKWATRQPKKPAEPKKSEPEKPRPGKESTQQRIARMVRILERGPGQQEIQRLHLLERAEHPEVRELRLRHENWLRDAERSLSLLTPRYDPDSAFRAELLRAIREVKAELSGPEPSQISEAATGAATALRRTTGGQSDPDTAAERRAAVEEYNNQAARLAGFKMYQIDFRWSAGDKKSRREFEKWLNGKLRSDQAAATRFRKQLEMPLAEYIANVKRRRALLEKTAVS